MRLLEVAMAMALLLSGCGNKDSGLPQPYRDLVVPEATLASAQARARGRKLFLTNCAICHGIHADGNGMRSEGLDPRPADFTSTAWRSQMTPRHAFYAIRSGVSGTAMPSWNTLSDEQTWELVAYVLSVSQPQ
jgi:mono/diheme cytochrome c family protein